MTVEIKTVISQLNIKDGSWRNETPNQIVAREPKEADMPGNGKGDLFVLTELQAAISDCVELETQLAQTVCDVYYLASGSTTAGLRRALQAAGDKLYRHNSQTGIKEKVIGGVVALVMSNDDAFIAQIGPVAFFAVTGDRIRRYPEQSVWLDSSPHNNNNNNIDKNEPVLGANIIIEPVLHHLRLQPDDMLILAGSSLAGRLSLQDVLNAVVPGNAKATAKNIKNIGTVNNGSALTVAVVKAEKSAFSLISKNAPAKIGNMIDSWQNQPTEARAMPKFVGAVSNGGKQMLTKLPTLFGFLSHDDKPNGKQHHEQDYDYKEPKMTDYPFLKKDSSHQQSYNDDTVNIEQEQEHKVMASMAHTKMYQQRQPLPEEKSSSITAGLVLGWLWSGLLIVIAFLGSGIKTVLEFIILKTGSRQPQQAGGQTHRYEENSTIISRKLLRNVAIALPILIVVIVIISYIQKGRLREAEYMELVNNAQNKFKQAQSAEANPAVAVSLMAEAESFLVQAEKIKENQPEITEQRIQMADTTDRIGNVQRLYYLPQLRQYTDVGTNLSSIVMQGVELYVLDTGTDRIFNHRLDDSGESLLPDNESALLIEQGQLVGDVTTADLQDIIWMPAGGNRQTSDLIILNSSGLLEYSTNWGVATVPMAGREQLISPVAVSSYFGNLYLLDPQANRLMRYLPTTDGYSSSPESYFPAEQPVDLSGAVDMAIDRAVYILYGDGRINKFEGGQPAEFSLRGLDRVFSNPVSIFTAPNEITQYLYVADAGNQRIVQLEKDGRFVRQFKPRSDEAASFANLQDIYVDEIGGRFYILDSNNLYMANIPTETIE